MLKGGKGRGLLHSWVEGGGDVAGGEGGGVRLVGLRVRGFE